MSLPAIPRDPSGAAGERWDLIVVGGGVYGCALLLEAARRGLRALLLERGDFASATSSRHLRILHGGLRYLQHLDVHRHRESVAARAWFLRELPELVEPLPCLMPLYGGLRRPAALRAAMWLDHRLSGAEAAVLPRGRVLSPGEVRERYPGAPSRGLLGGALWYDARMRHAVRIPLEMLRAACARGAVALNYVEARDLVVADGKVAGVRALDRESGAELGFSAPVVLNAAGPGVRALAARWDRDVPGLFVSTRAWNLVLDVAPPAREALALAAPRTGAPTYFLVPNGPQQLCVGTVHAPGGPPGAGPGPTPAELDAFLRDLAAAAPGLGIARERVARILAGELPGVSAGSAALARRPVVHPHAERGGPRGLWSVSGVKFTTARAVACSVVARVFSGRALATEPVFDPAESAARALRARAASSGEDALVALGADESALHLDDLLLRRAALGDDPRAARALATRLSEKLGWDSAHAAAERARVELALAEGFVQSEAQRRPGRA